MEYQCSSQASSAFWNFVGFFRDCIRLINHSSLGKCASTVLVIKTNFVVVCKPHPGNEILVFSFIKDMSTKELCCFEAYRLLNQHSINKSVHKFCLSTGEILCSCCSSTRINQTSLLECRETELYIGDKDGAISIFDLINPDTLMDSNNIGSCTAKMVGVN